MHPLQIITIRKCLLKDITAENSKKKKTESLEENEDIAFKVGGAAKKAVLEIEKKTDKAIVSTANSKKLI